MLDASGIRAKANSFDATVRGFRQADVQAYLGRIALVVEVLGKSGDVPPLPPDFSPRAIRDKEFSMVWRGVDADQVRAYLDEVADLVQQRLEAPAAAPTPAVSALALPSSFASQVAEAQAAGLLGGAEIVAGSARRPVMFCTPEGLTRYLAANLAKAETCLVSNVIIVSEITAETMTKAVNHLVARGEL